jgi:eukaryotic-like serine/threonine-protein kinase
MATCPTCRTRYPGHVRVCEADGEQLLPDEAFSAADSDLQPGAVVGEYRVEAKLGEGGFGSVYRAVHPLIGKAAAIKVLNRQYSSNPQMVSRFIAEARAVNQIRHRSIVDIFAFGSLDDGRQYYVMELLEGMTFDRYIREQGRLSPEAALPILRALGRALDAAHAAGIAHRDLKPENIILTFDEDGGVFPKLLDFGIAKLMVDSGMTHKTRTGTPIGTPQYMSPEQCRGKNVDHRTDVYSFGVLIYEALTGQLPFDGDDVMELMVKHTTAVAPAASTVHAGLPAALDAPLAHMLEKDPARRPSTVGAAVEELAEAAASAGLVVQRPRARTPGELGPGPAVVHTAKRMTPSEVGDLAEARTLPHGARPRTHFDAESDVPRPGGRRTALWVGGAAALLCVGVALALGARGRAQAPAPEPQAAAALPPRAPSDAPEATTPTPPPAAPAPPTHVEVRIESTPPGAEVWMGAAKLGAAPGPFRLPRGEAPVALTVRAEGHRQASVEVVPSANTAATVTLPRAAPPPGTGNKPKGPGHGDLEF